MLGDTKLYGNKTLVIKYFGGQQKIYVKHFCGIFFWMNISFVLNCFGGELFYCSGFKIEVNIPVVNILLGS